MPQQLDFSHSVTTGDINKDWRGNFTIDVARLQSGPGELLSLNVMKATREIIPSPTKLRCGLPRPTARMVRPDWVGTGLNLFDGGMSLLAVSNLVVPILGLSNTAFVNTVYRKVVGVLPSATDRDFYVGLLQGSITRETVLIGFSESAENQAALIGVIQGGIAYTPG